MKKFLLIFLLLPCIALAQSSSGTPQVSAVANLKDDQVSVVNNNMQILQNGVNGLVNQLNVLSTTNRSGNEYWSPEFTATNSIDWSNGNVQYIALTGSGTLTMANPQSGGRYLLILKQPSGGSAVMTWPGNVVFPGDATPVLTTTGNKVDVIALVYDGVNSKYYASISNNY